MAYSRLVQLLILILLWGGVGASLQAQPGNPADPRDYDLSAWVYNVDTGQMIRLNAEGELDRINLPMPPGFELWLNATVSPDGRYVAYVVTDFDYAAQQLVIYDYDLGTMIAQYSVFDMLYNSLMMGNGRMFNAASTEFAFGYALESGEWELIIIELATLSVKAALRSGEPLAISAPTGYGLTPTPTYFRPDGSIAFAMVQGGAGGAREYRSFIWDDVRGTLEETLGYGALGLDVYPPTGEVIASYEDGRLPNTSSRFFFGQANTVQVFDPLMGVRFPFFVDALNDILSAHFVNNGQLIVVLSAGAELDDPVVGVVVDREGNLLEDFPSSVAIRNVIGTGDGYVLLAVEGDLTFVGFVNIGIDGIASRGVVPWNGGDGEYWQLIWAGKNDGTPMLTVGTYPEWGRLASATTDFGGGAGEDFTPAELIVGGIATVRTTDGDALNLRSGAGTQFQRIERLPTGTQVTLLEGPVSAEGFVWWRLRTSTGTEGWAVESANDVVTLVPGRTASTGGVIDESLEGRANPSLPSLLSVGDTARVTLTSSRDALRLRNSPALTDSRVVQLMPDGTQVRVMDGPRDADGFRWWQVRTPEGNLGWAAEITGNNRTLTRIAP